MKGKGNKNVSVVSSLRSVPGLSLRCVWHHPENLFYNLQFYSAKINSLFVLLSLSRLCQCLQNCICVSLLTVQIFKCFLKGKFSSGLFQLKLQGQRLQNKRDSHVTMQCIISTCLFLSSIPDLQSQWPRSVCCCLYSPMESAWIYMILIRLLISKEVTKNTLPFPHPFPPPVHAKGWC